MAYGQPSNNSLDDWYAVAKNIDQNHTSNQVFESAYRTPKPVVLHCTQLNPTHIPHLVTKENTDCPLEFDIRTMTTKGLRKDLMIRKAAVPEGEKVAPKKKCPMQIKKTPPLTSHNCFEVLSNICNSEMPLPEIKSTPLSVAIPPPSLCQF